MSRVAELLRSRRMPQVAVLTLMSVGFAGCSADMQTRLSDSSFSNPFASQPEATGSVRVARRRAPRAAAICPAAGAPRRNSSPRPCRRPPPLRRTLIRPARAGCREEGAGFRPMRRRPVRRSRPPPRCRRARSRPRARPRRTAPRSSSAPATRSTFWRSATTFRAAAILQANGYKGPRALSPGQQLIIPRQTAGRCARADARAAGQQAGCRCGRRRRASTSSIAAIR